LRQLCESILDDAAGKRTATIPARLAELAKAVDQQPNVIASDCGARLAAIATSDSFDPIQSRLILDHLVQGISKSAGSQLWRPEFEANRMPLSSPSSGTPVILLSSLMDAGAGVGRAVGLVNQGLQAVLLGLYFSLVLLTTAALPAFAERLGSTNAMLRNSAYVVLLAVPWLAGWQACIPVLVVLTLLSGNLSMQTAKKLLKFTIVCSLLLGVTEMLRGKFESSGVRRQLRNTNGIVDIQDLPDWAKEPQRTSIQTLLMMRVLRREALFAEALELAAKDPAVETYSDAAAAEVALLKFAAEPGEKSRKGLETLYERGFKHPAFVFLLPKVLFDAGDLQRARTLVEEAQKLDPEMTKALQASEGQDSTSVFRAVYWPLGYDFGVLKFDPDKLSKPIYAAFWAAVLALIALIAALKIRPWDPIPSSAVHILRCVQFLPGGARLLRSSLGLFWTFSTICAFMMSLALPAISVFGGALVGFRPFLICLLLLLGLTINLVTLREMEA
jgi:hypothetical protein